VLAAGGLGQDALTAADVIALVVASCQSFGTSEGGPDAADGRTGMLEPGTSVDSLAGKLARFAGSGIDEAFVDAFALFPSLDQMLDFAQTDRDVRAGVNDELSRAWRADYYYFTSCARN
jgi:hypothetical protein